MEAWLLAALLVHSDVIPTKQKATSGPSTSLVCQDDNLVGLAPSSARSLVPRVEMNLALTVAVANSDFLTLPRPLDDREERRLLTCVDVVPARHRRRGIVRKGSGGR